MSLTPLPAAVQPSLATHPRARRSIRRVRAWAALAGFALAALAAEAAGFGTFDVGVRALAGGIAGGLVGWALAVIVWRQLALAEIRAELARRAEERRAATEDEPDPYAR